MNPYMQTNGTKVWFHNGKIHRDDGPAVIYADRSTRWFIKDVPCSTTRQFQELSGLQKEDLTLLTLRHGGIQ